jgi:hypothetical protein
MNDNKRPTPLTDAEASRIGGHSQPSDRVSADFARTLEQMLAERTEERDNLLEKQSWLIVHPTAIEAAHQVVEWTKCEQERDTALAKLAKCRTALESIARYDKDSKHGDGICPYGCDTPSIARQTLEETK